MERINLSGRKATFGFDVIRGCKRQNLRAHSGVFVFPLEIAHEMIERADVFPYHIWPQETAYRTSTTYAVRSNTAMAWLAALDDADRGIDLEYIVQDSIYWLYHDIVHVRNDVYRPQGFQYKFCVSTCPDGELRALVDGAIMASEDGVPVHQIFEELSRADCWAEGVWRCKFDSFDRFQAWRLKQCLKISQ